MELKDFWIWCLTQGHHKRDLSSQRVSDSSSCTLIIFFRYFLFVFVHKDKKPNCIMGMIWGFGFESQVDRKTRYIDLQEVDKTLGIFINIFEAKPCKPFFPTRWGGIFRGIPTQDNPWPLQVITPLDFSFKGPSPCNPNQGPLTHTPQWDIYESSSCASLRTPQLKGPNMRWVYFFLEMEY